MLVAIGMYLPISITSAIFVGGVVRWIGDRLSERALHNQAQRARVENAGVLVASGFIAGEALSGLVIAAFNFQDWNLPEIFKDPSYLAGAVVMALMGVVLVLVSYFNAGDPNEPAPPVAMM
jgi:MFS family permease